MMNEHMNYKANLLHCVQVKMELPVHVHEKHHLLFTFYHISCESSSKAGSKRREGVESLGESAEKCLLHANVSLNAPLVKHENCNASDLFVMRSSGLLLGAFAERRANAVSGASAARSGHLASWLPVSGHQEGKESNQAFQSLHYSL